MLYKIWGYKGGDYEEYRLLRYKNPVRTSEETHYVSATEPTTATIKNCVFCDVTSCGFCKNRRYCGTYRLYHQGDKVLRLLITHNVPSSPILGTLIMEATSSSETLVPIRVTQRDISEGALLQF
jgi:hypothetical protein